MELFQPNNLSRVRPEFTPVHDLSLCGELSAALNSCYDLTDLSSFRVSSFVGANVLSQNFLVDIGSKRHFLKWRRAEQQNSLEQEAELAAGLTKLGSKVPRVICTKVGTHVCSWKESCCALYVFEEGNYYTGQGKELDSAAAAFGELTATAARLFAQHLQTGGAAAGAFLEDLDRLLQEATINSDPAVANLCREHHRMMLKQLHEVRAKRALVESQLLPMHLDYHPLNLLMRDGEVGCILDLEHLKPYPVLAGLGFAGYKLIRQAMVNAQVRTDEFANPSLARRWLAGWARSFPQKEFSPTELGLGARYHVLSLIHFILEAGLRRGDDRFNYDLEKQISSLYEIEAIAAGY